MDEGDAESGCCQADGGEGFGGFVADVGGESGGGAGGEEVVTPGVLLSVLDGDPGLAVEVFGADLAACCQGVGAGDGQEHRVFQEGVRAGRGRFGVVARGQGDVEAALAQAFELFVGGEAVEGDVDAGVFLVEGAQCLGQQAGVHGVADVADAQAAFLAAAEAAAEVLQACGVPQQGCGFGEEDAAVAGEPEALLAALEQGQAEVLLELGDLPAER